MRTTHGRFAARFLCAALAAALLLVGGSALWAEKGAQGKIEVEEGVYLVASYLAHDGELTPNPAYKLDAKAAKDYEDVRDYIWGAIPDDIKDLIGKFELTESADDSEESTDGSVGLSEDEKYWEYALDYALGENALSTDDQETDIEFDKVIAHEVAHIIALNASQMGKGGTYVVEEGALKKGAYLDTWYKTYWQKQYPDYEETGEDDPEFAAELYEEYPDAFVTDYAATSPNEDLAESFAAFVTEPKPAGKAEKDKKVLFFYSYPELVAYRDAMRASMDSSK